MRSWRASWQQLHEHNIATSAAAIARTAEGMLRHPDRGIILLARLGRRAVGIAALSALWTLEHGGRAIWLRNDPVLEEEEAGEGLAQAPEAARQAQDRHRDTGTASAALTTASHRRPGVAAGEDICAGGYWHLTMTRANEPCRPRTVGVAGGGHDMNCSYRGDAAGPVLSGPRTWHRPCSSPSHRFSKMGGSTMKTTLLDLITAIQDCTTSDAEVVATVVHL